MGLFSKKEKVPEIPPAPTLPELPGQNSELSLPEPPKQTHELPSFPQDMKENINQEMVKSAVGDTSENEEVKVEELPRDFDFEERKGLIPSIPHEGKKTIEMSPSETREKTTKQIEPVFVRIDKFQKAQKDFEQIKKQVKQIETILNKIQQTKEKEDAEISAWTEDMQNIKSKLAEIDENIFNKLE